VVDLGKGKSRNILRIRKAQLVVIVLIAAANCSFSQTSASSPKTVVGHRSSHATVQYVNKRFGFRFTLPAGWRGYTIVMDEWGGGEEKGPCLSIRHPHWTEESPRQDIPILIFTHPQWRLVNGGNINVSAAPYGPSEIGRNRRYVFALPPRYNIDQDDGYEEVNEIMGRKPLHAF